MPGIPICLASQSHAALTAGDIAIIGRTNNGTPDSFSFVALTSITAGEVIYFTDNGWTGTQFRGASATDGDGNENLMKFEATTTIPIGTIIQTNTTSANYAFTVAGLVPGGTSGSFADLSQSTGGEQIYAFQGTASLPLFNPTQHLFVLDDTNGFENATNTNNGNITPGLSLGTTAVTVNFTTAGTIAFNTSIITSGTKAEWLTEIGKTANWSAGSLPSGSISVIPEPSAALLGAFGALGLLRRRRA